MKKKKFIIIAIIGFLGIAALFGNTEEDIPEVAEVDTKTEETQADEVEEKEAQDKAAAEKAAAAEKEKAAKEKAEAEKVANEKDAADLEQLHLTIMQDHMSMYVDITFDKETKIFKMTPTDEQLISEIEMLPLGIGWDNWQDMVDGVVSMSKANSGDLGVGYSIT